MLLFSYKYKALVQIIKPETRILIYLKTKIGNVIFEIRADLFMSEIFKIF